uniref:Uncharacterized protein n=1 Tax=Prolemur simus TaxID=1328070 RepID=A0A8C8Z1J0_PROSS
MSPLQWLRILRVGDSHLSSLCSASFLPSQAQGRREEQTQEQQRSPEVGSQRYRELPRVFLPQKFLLATAVALSQGLKGGSGATMAGLAVSTPTLPRCEDSR